MNRETFRKLASHLLSLLVLVFALASLASAQRKEKVLYSFQGGTDGAVPAGGVVFDKDGNAYGATRDGGAATCASIYQCGTVYQLVPPATRGKSWTENVLYVFKGNAGADGASPGGGLIADVAGNLYGTTQYGGTGGCILLGVKVGCGAVYRVTPPQKKGRAWKETILYSFKGGKDGYVPFGDLVFDSAGNLYGATFFGGGKGTTCDPYYQYCGTVFKLSPPKTKGGKWTEKVLYSFKGGTDGANPNGSLVLNRKGAIYGTTYSGGNQDCSYEGESGCGTAFELQPPSKKDGVWAEKVLYHFDRSSSDGGNPMAGLVLGADQKFYGTTLNGGPEGGGVAFRLSPPRGRSGTWTETILNAFGNNVLGYDLEAPLVFDQSGNLYGTANAGSGGATYGNIFRLKPISRKGQHWTVNVLYDFAGVPDGEYPAAGLTFDKSGNLYGTTQDGGTGSSCSFTACGTVFEVSP